MNEKIKEKCPTREQKKKKKRTQGQTNTSPENVECIMGSLMKRKLETEDINPSHVAQSKLCNEMGEKHVRTPSLEEASFATTTS
jgi:hypothetical protein